MKPLVLSVLGAIALAAVTTSASAQTPAAPATKAPAASGGKQLYLGVLGGAQAVQNVGGVFGGELGFHVTPKFDAFATAAWLQDTVTRRRAELATSVASYVQKQQGKTADGTIDAPAWFYGGGGRVFLTAPKSVRPFVVVEAGAARVTLRPTFTLSGGDITKNLPQYGVTLGSDLTGTSTKAAFGGGFGVQIIRSAWYIDAGLRVTSIKTPEQPTNVIRLNLGFGRGF